MRAGIRGLFLPAVCRICFLRSAKYVFWGPFTRSQECDEHKVLMIIATGLFTRNSKTFIFINIQGVFFSKGPTHNSYKYEIGPSQQDNSTWWRDVEWVPSARRAHLVRFPGTFHIKHCPNLVHHGFITNPLFAFLTRRSALSQIFQSALFPELLEEPVDWSPWGRRKSIAHSPCRGRPPDGSEGNKTIP